MLRTLPDNTTALLIAHSQGVSFVFLSLSLWRSCRNMRRVWQSSWMPQIRRANAEHYASRLSVCMLDYQNCELAKLPRCTHANGPAVLPVHTVNSLGATASAGECGRNHPEPARFVTISQAAGSHGNTCSTTPAVHSLKIQLRAIGLQSQACQYYVLGIQ